MPNEKRILVADDESHIRSVVSLKLRNAGYAVETAGDGREALEMATARRPDLIITDYHMPELSGLELCQRLQESPATAGIPTILLTAQGYSLDSQEVQRHGVLQMLSKPFSPREVLATVNRILNVANLAA